MLPGVYAAKKTNGTPYYRSNITYRSKHISLGSFSTEQGAHQAYLDAQTLLSDSSYSLLDARLKKLSLSFDKIVTLINFRDNNLYIGTPIYMKKGYFSYYLSSKIELKFDIDDLFYYSSHRIMKRKGHLYVNDYGMQVTILSRYGVKPHAVVDRDFRFVNGDCNDYRYSNIEVINPYYGVQQIERNGIIKYKTKIHMNGDFTIGSYSTPEKAAIAYNKAIDYARRYGINRNFTENYIETLSASEYANIYTKLSISTQYIQYLKGLPD